MRVGQKVFVYNISEDNIHPSIPCTINSITPLKSGQEVVQDRKRVGLFFEVPMSESKSHFLVDLKEKKRVANEGFSGVEFSGLSEEEQLVTLIYNVIPIRQNVESICVDTKHKMELQFVHFGSLI